MKTSLLLSSLVLGLGLATSGAALAHGDGERHQYRSGEHGSHMERMARHLDLSDDQRQQIRAAMQAHGPEMRELRRQIREQREAIRKQSADSFNEEGVRNHATTLGELTGQAAFLSARMRSDVHAVLTDEQREKLAARGERHHGKPMHRGGGMHRGEMRRHHGER